MRYNVNVIGLLYPKRMSVYLVSKRAACSASRRNTLLVHDFPHVQMQCIWL